MVSPHYKPLPRPTAESCTVLHASLGLLVQMVNALAGGLSHLQMILTLSKFAVAHLVNGLLPIAPLAKLVPNRRTEKMVYVLL